MKPCKNSLGFFNQVIGIKDMIICILLIYANIQNMIVGFHISIAFTVNWESANFSFSKFH